MENYKDFFVSLSKEEIDRINQQQFEETLKEHKDFKDNFDKGQCYICKKGLNTVEENNPCYHWLLLPKGIKKKHLEKFLKVKIGFLTIQTYLRWVANTDKPLKNINDLKEEMNPSKLFESTICYKNIEWSFSFGESDFQGHQNSPHTNFPHYHLQIRNNGHYFIVFNDFHIPFSQHDLFALKASNESPHLFKIGFPFGEGMQEAMTEEFMEEIFDKLNTTDDFENATFNVQTLVEAPKGQTISGDQLADLIEESKKTGQPIAVLLKKAFPNTSSMIFPGDGVPEISKRNPRKKK